MTEAQKDNIDIDSKGFYQIFVDMCGVEEIHLPEQSWEAKIPNRQKFARQRIPDKKC